MEIITNNQPRLICDWEQIPESVREQEFDYLCEEDAPGRDFIKYKGQWYDLGEFMLAPQPLRELGWEGFSADSMFSGIAIKYCGDDPDSVIVAQAFS